MAGTANILIIWGDDIDQSDLIDRIARGRHERWTTYPYHPTHQPCVGGCDLGPRIGDLRPHQRCDLRP